MKEVIIVIENFGALKIEEDKFIKYSLIDSYDTNLETLIEDVELILNDKIIDENLNRLEITYKHIVTKGLDESETEEKEKTEIIYFRKNDLKTMYISEIK